MLMLMLMSRVSSLAYAYVMLMLVQRCQPTKIEIRETANFASKSTLFYHKNGAKTAKMLQIFQIFSLNSVKMRVKTRILSTFLRIREIWSSVRETGRFGLYPGDSRIIRESWHICLCYAYALVRTSLNCSQGGK